MDQQSRNSLQRATQRSRQILEKEFAEQLEGTFDVLNDGTIHEEPGQHLNAEQRLTRKKLIEAIHHMQSGGKTQTDAIAMYVRESAFTFLNRFVALRMLESRKVLLECVSNGDQSNGFKEFCGLAPGFGNIESGYRLYLECLFDELSVEIKVLFDRRDPASLLWPRRAALGRLLETIGEPNLADVWQEDETIGWIYQYFNSEEERKQMRDESPKAPRNSRELAVRNQFFTPRYVVEFLVDNTLGRLWYEMRKGKTRLVDTCNYLIRQDEEVFLAPGETTPRQTARYVPHRAKKDPRDLAVLDPACGSGHFLLYAFDLLLNIYQEAWSDESPVASKVTDSFLRDDYVDTTEFYAAIPSLILRHNLHGVDIDPRAAQIAAFALWMRAQAAFERLGDATTERAVIRKSNIVCAEGVPGDKSVVDDFVSEHVMQLDGGKLLGQLIYHVVETMRLAGEVGMLLRFEDVVAEIVAAAKEQWSAQPLETQKLLFDSDEPDPEQLELDFSEIADESLWRQFEARIVKALRKYAESRASSGYSKRLFSEDTAAGLAFLDICHRRYDVVLMNPPFGAGSLAAKQAFDEAYPLTKNDVYAAFVERGVELLMPRGRLGAITSRTGFFLPSFQKWRENVLLKCAPPAVFSDLGYGVLDSALVEVAAYVLEKGRTPTHECVFIRVLECDDKAQSLRHAIRNGDENKGDRGLTYQVSPASFNSVPGSPFAYWVGAEILGLFEHPAWKTAIRPVAKNGLGTLGDFRFVRLATEVPAYTDDSDDYFFPMCNGGRHSPYYQDFVGCVNWHRNGIEVKAHIEFAYGGGHWSRSARSVDYYFRPGFTWPVRGVRFSAQSVPAGCIFSVAGKMAFVPEDNLQAFHAIFNSSMFAFLIRVQSDAVRIQFQGGLIQRSPIPLWSKQQEARLAALSHRAWTLKRSLDTRNETSHAFTVPALLQMSGTTLKGRSVAWLEHETNTEAAVAQTQAEIDALCFDLYEIGPEQRQVIQQRMSGDTSEGDLDDQPDNADTEELIEELISWFVGIVFGRFDVRLATGERQAPAEPQPFDPLPRCSAGMLTDGVLTETTDYPLPILPNRILVNDEGHPEDLATALRTSFELVFGDDAEDYWDQAAIQLAPKKRSVRNWLQSNFFAHHVKQYSSSRRKAPIYWQLSTPSGSYAVWLYFQRLSKDTMFKVLNECVRPKLDYERQKFERMLGEAGEDPTRSQRKLTEEQHKLVLELSNMAEEIDRVAPLWDPNLNDGVIINFAPLWRLVPHDKSWQKQCNKIWKQLVDGDHDWAHLAMRLWPERVVPKCITNASLAIAHGLETTFWMQRDGERFAPIEEPANGWSSTVEKLIVERTTPAVKAALADLIEAPDARTVTARRK